MNKKDPNAGRVGNGHRRDGAEEVARSSDGQINTTQVRMLIFLREVARTGVKEADKQQIKAATKHWPHRKGYHRDWVNCLKSLTPELVEVSQYESNHGGGSKFYYRITIQGLRVLATAEAKSQRTL